MYDNVAIRHVNRVKHYVTGPSFSKSARKNTNLHIATIFGELASVRKILSDDGANIISRWQYEWFHILSARETRSRNEDIEHIKWKSHEFLGYTILHWTCYRGFVMMAKYILSQDKVDINSRDK